MKKIVIVGIGVWGKNLLREFSKVSDVYACIAKGNKENINWLKENYPKTRYYTELDVVLSDKSIDAVVVATPISTHFTLASKVLERNKHVFIEKPTATTLSEFDQLARLAKQKNKLLFTGYIFLYHDVYRHIKKNITDIKAINMIWKKWGTFKEDIQWNLLSHDISICLDLLGVPSKAEYTFKNKDKIDFKMGYRDLSVSILIDRRSRERYKRINLKTTSGFYIWENDSLYEKKNEKITLIAKEKTSPLKNEINSFFYLIDNFKLEKDCVSRNVIELVNKLSET